MLIDLYAGVSENITLAKLAVENLRRVILHRYYVKGLSVAVVLDDMHPVCRC
jgi:hypothetical protein